MNTLEINEENVLAFLAYKELGGKRHSNTFFEQYVGNDHFIEYVLRNKELSCNLLIDKHTYLDKNQKLKLLNKIIYNKELLEMFISTNKLRLTIGEYQLIIPQVVNKFPDIFDKLARITAISDSEFIRKLKLDKEVEEKLTGLLVINKLS